MTVTPLISYSLFEQKIFEQLKIVSHTLGIPTYLVGGFVRDKILSLNPVEADLCCLGDAHLVADEFVRNYYPSVTVKHFKRFGTAHISLFDKVFNCHFIIQLSSTRKESYNPTNRNPTVSNGNFMDDQERRDFTVNTLAIHLDNLYEIIDTFSGIKDMENKIIRTPMDPLITFSDDPLRMLRAIRFATQLDFTIVPETLSGITNNASRIKIVAQERITEELNKIICTAYPSKGFYLLEQTGLLDIILPELTKLRGATYIDGIGHKDNFAHTLQVLDNVAQESNDIWLRWAALLHDIAKPITKKFQQNIGWSFHGHEVKGAYMVPKIFAKLKLPLNEKMAFVKKLVLLHLRPISLTQDNISDSAVRRLLFDAGEDINALMILCKADITSKNKTKVAKFIANFTMVQERMKEIEDKDHLRNWKSPISGECIMNTFNIGPGYKVGILKTYIKDAILDGIIDNNYTAAYNLMIEKAKELELVVPDAIKK
ncbi:MAG: HD domain-containing protein [Phycisphaerales bacterium]|nr:HD domain-containing protein [Phycisphaerales bacterium]